MWDKIAVRLDESSKVSTNIDSKILGVNSQAPAALRSRMSVAPIGWWDSSIRSLLYKIILSDRDSGCVTTKDVLGFSSNKY
jgi:hypothetical protein